MNFKELENDIVKLQPLQSTDFERLFKVGSDPQIWEQHPDSSRYTLEGFTYYFHQLLQTEAPYLIILKSTNEIIGATSFYQYDKKASNVAIGYTFLSKINWGGEINKSVKDLMICYAFDFVDKVFFHVRDKNFRFQAALQKIGALKVREYPASHDPNSLQYEFVLTKPKD